MKYEAIVKKCKTAFEKADCSKVSEHVAVQFNVTGEGEGAFYLEIAEGKASVEPYEYFDRDILVYADADVILDIAAGKTDFVSSYVSGKLHAEGNLGKAELLKDVVLKKRATSAKKADSKKEAEKEVTTEKKPATKKTSKATEKKATDEKTDAKKEKTVEKKVVKKEVSLPKNKKATLKITVEKQVDKKVADKKADENTTEKKTTAKKSTAKKAK